MAALKPEEYQRLIARNTLALQAKEEWFHSKSNRQLKCVSVVYREQLWDYSNESYWAVLSCGVVI